MLVVVIGRFEMLPNWIICKLICRQSDEFVAAKLNASANALKVFEHFGLNLDVDSILRLLSLARFDPNKSFRCTAALAQLINSTEDRCEQVNPLRLLEDLPALESGLGSTAAESKRYVSRAHFIAICYAIKRTNDERTKATTKCVNKQLCGFNLTTKTTTGSLACV